MPSAPALETTAPMPPFVPKPTPRRSSSLIGWALVALVFVLSMIAIAGALFWTGWFESFFRAPRAPETQSPSPVVAPTSTAPPIAAARTSDLGACCPTERAKCTGPTHFSCPACPGPRPHIPPGYSWVLRVEAVRSGTENLVETRPDAVLTMRLGDAKAELPLAWIAKKRAGEASLHVTTEDVENHRVRFTLADGEVTLADGNGHVDASKGHEVLVSALCAGLVLYVDRPSGGSITLSTYLDPEAQPP
jgi:hypothetical protein